MEPETDTEKELGSPLAGRDGSEGGKRSSSSDQTMTSSPDLPAQEPPKRSLPPRPTSRIEHPSPARRPEALNRPPPIRPPRLRPQAPLAMNPPTRPGTAGTQTSGTAGTIRFPGSTKRLSWTSIASSRARPIKYGQGKYSRVELVPQPSNDPDDPLNWPSWRKELNFASLLLMVAMTGVMKTILITVNAQLAESYGVSYTAVAALTGVPLILSALSGLVCLVISRICGKRPVYLMSLLSVFIGVAWNTNVTSSYAQCMAARVFQGLGWGAFDTLVLGSIQDTYFEHERRLRISIHSVVAVAATWVPPLIGGVTSQHQTGFSLQFTILSAFFMVAVPAIALGAPETVFDRAYTLAQTPATTASSKYKASLPLTPRSFFSVETFYNYIVKLKPYSYSGSCDLVTLLQAPRALITPTATLLAMVSILPYSSLWGLAASLSLLFHPLPFNLLPSSIGALMTGPFLLSTTAVAIPALVPMAIRLLRRSQFNPKPNLGAKFSREIHVLIIAAGSLLTFVGLLAFGLHIKAALTPTAEDLLASSSSPPTTDPAAETSVYALDYLGMRVNLAAMSFVLGLVAAGAYALDATVRPAVAASTAFTSSNLGVAMRNTADMSAAVACWRAAFSGAFVMAFPAAVWASFDGLQTVCVALATVQMAVGIVLAAIWWFFGEGLVRRWDGRVMRLVDLEALKGGGDGGVGGSFFDTD